MLYMKLSPEGQVRVFEKTGEFIPFGSFKFVKVTCPRVPHSLPTTMLLEPGGSDLAPGLLLTPALLHVFNRVTYVPVVNVGATGTTVHSKQVLGVLHSIEGVDGQHLSFEGENEEVAWVSTHSTREPSISVLETITAFGWPGLSPEEEKLARDLLRKYSDVFTKHEGDLGCTDEIVHERPLLDDVPVRQRYRRIPPTQWQAMKDHIKQLLESKVIWESSSPYASPIVLV